MHWIGRREFQFILVLELCVEGPTQNFLHAHSFHVNTLS